MNSIVLMGRLTRDPERKVTGSGIEYCLFTLAVDRRFKNDAGERQTDFIPVTAWKQQSAFICKYFAKGDMICVQGALQTRKYNDAEGKPRTAYDVQAEQATFCGGKRDGAAQSGQAAACAAQNIAQGRQVVIDADDPLPF
ncbi:MAG: single-stranded DNA-binding protein [Clostridia bacterium]